MRRLHMMGGTARARIVGPRTGALPVLGPMRWSLPYARKPRRHWAAALVLLVVLAGLAAVLAARRSDNSAQTAPAAQATPAIVTAPSVVVRPPVSARPTPAPAVVAPRRATKPPKTTPAGPPVPHRAIYADGKLYLVGSVPDQATGRKLYDKAVAVVGVSNVIDRYTIDARVPKITDGRVIVAQRFVFPFASAVLDPAYSNVLQLGYIVMTQNPQVTMVINGYTDATGDPNLNLLLSQARAYAVVQYYAARGIDPKRFVPIGHGQADPVASNDTDAGRAQNRRIDVTLLHLVG
ncbi:MAG: hypothetical protein JWN46_3861 [Acidimicrobiales bacterium]|nr:hypothetical protein [Acidimicrobiales bacterium]